MVWWEKRAGTAPPGNPPYLGRYREHQHLELLAASMAGGMENPKLKPLWALSVVLFWDGLREQGW